jgi:hypothetical protein
MKTYAAALVLTILIELATTAILGYRRRHLWLGVVLVNICTHPALNLLLAANAKFGLISPPLLLLAFLEVAVVLVEYYLLRDTFGKTGVSFFTLSLAMNFNSFAAGVLIFWR